LTRAQEAVAADMEAALGAAHDRAAAAAAAAAEADTALKASKDSLLRLNAEFQNFRNRTEREKTARSGPGALVRVV
jgi:molecular chaperone GrpE (heat shock protein)